MSSPLWRPPSLKLAFELPPALKATEDKSEGIRMGLIVIHALVAQWIEQDPSKVEI